MKLPSRVCPSGMFQTEPPDCPCARTQHRAACQQLPISGCKGPGLALANRHHHGTNEETGHRLKSPEVLTKVFTPSMSGGRYQSRVYVSEESGEGLGGFQNQGGFATLLDAYGRWDWTLERACMWHTCQTNTVSTSQYLMSCCICGVE